MKHIQDKNYNIFFNEWSALKQEIKKLAPSQVYILVDENTEKYCLFHFLAYIDDPVQIIKINSGEINKNINTCQFVWESLLNKGADRQALLINLGGGVIGDLGGFCAATYMRGIRFIQIPTTLLSQVDASIGGKLGIDFLHFKNMIGLYETPQSIFIFTEFLKTLPEKELKSGYAEVLKHSLIADKNAWDKRSFPPKSGQYDYDSIIYQSVLIKKMITDQDPKESGLRKVLNYGHTIGHALESYWMNSDTPLLHGEALAIGMITEAFISYRLGKISEETLFEIRRAILQIYGHHPRYVKPMGKLLKLMQADKKNIGDEYRFALLESIGSACYDISVPHAFIEEGLIFYSTVLK